tara:strand:- start:240 stop:443 length:204 start_codon:yes stop_codon:yes gene_type:complete
MTKETIAAKIEQAQQAQQKRAHELVTADVLWMCLQTEITMWNQRLGEKDETVEKPDSAPEVPEAKKK